jgi:hypothetical protein
MGWPYQHKPPLGWPIDPDHPLSDFVGFCPMLVGSAGQVFDLSGNGNNFTLAGHAHYGPGKFGSCLKLDGTGDYASLATPSIFPINADTQFRNGTVCLWAKPNNVTDLAKGIFSFGDAITEGDPSLLIQQNQEVLLC